MKYKIFVLFTFCLVLFVSATSATAQATDTSGWYQFHKDAAHTGFTMSDAPDTNNMLWESIDINAVIASSPVIADGIVYVNGDDHVKMIDMYTGEYLGDTDIQGNNNLGSWVSPTYHEGRIWCGHPDGVNGGTLVANDKYYHGNYDKDTYFCYDLNNDTQLWNFTVTGYAQGTPAYSHGNIYLTSTIYETRGHVYCLDADTGQPYWTTYLPEEAGGSALVTEDAVFVTTYMWGYEELGHLYALNRTNGEILWNAPIERSTACAAYAYGNIYVCGGCLSVSPLKTYCFNATNGTLLWSVENIGDWKCSVAVADGKVFAGKAHNEDMFSYQGIYALDAFDGSVIWAYGRGGSGPAISDGIVYTVGENGKVYAYGADAADLKCSLLEYDYLISGQKSNLTATIQNNGNMNAASFDVSLIVDGIVEDTQNIPSLSSASAENITFQWTPLAEGQYEVMIKSDILYVIDERDETNNELVLICNTADWNPWNDENSEGGNTISTPELQECINCWVSSTPAPITGEEVTTSRLQGLINDWLMS